MLRRTHLPRRHRRPVLRNHFGQKDFRGHQQIRRPQNRMLNRVLHFLRRHWRKRRSQAAFDCWRRLLRSLHYIRRRLRHSESRVLRYKCFDSFSLAFCYCLLKRRQLVLHHDKRFHGRSRRPLHHFILHACGTPCWLRYFSRRD